VIACAAMAWPLWRFYRARAAARPAQVERPH